MRTNLCLLVALVAVIAISAVLNASASAADTRLGRQGL